MSELTAYDPIQPRVPNDSARGSILAGICVLVAFFGGLGGWAAYAPLNGAVVASGVVKVEGNRKSIQHLDGGIVKELKVKEGERVQAGQTLIVLDDIQARAMVLMLTQQYDVFRAEEARLLAELDGAPAVTFPPDLLRRRDDPNLRMLLNGESRQFEVRRTALNGQTSVLQQRVQELQEQIKGSRAQQTAQTEQLALIKSELADQNDLLAKGLTLRPRVLQLQRAESALKGQSGEIMGEVAKAQQAIGEIKLQIIQLQNGWMTDVAKDLREIQAKVLDVMPRLQAAQDVLNRTEIRSPYAGYVVGLSVFSVGGVIGRGDRIMDIVPTNKDLAVEANVNVNDIHDLHPGMRAELHFTAYKQRVIPVIHGEVIEVAADRFTDNHTGVPYYTALVKVDERELEQSKDVKLYPGMAVTVMIPTRERTALDYLLGPVVESFDRAFRQQ
jgi:HlyD family type I secretion membrane fusion protein